MKNGQLRTMLLHSAPRALARPACAQDDKIVVGFATGQSGFMQAYDEPATQDAAMIRIDEINKAGGLLGKQIEVVTRRHQDRPRRGRQGRPRSASTSGADLVVVSCDYDFGAPAALMAESNGKVSFFLCAESVRAGIQGVGPHSFSASVLAAVQGATMAEWGHEKLDAADFYVLEDTWTEYNKGICDGFDWTRAADRRVPRSSAATPSSTTTPRSRRRSPGSSSLPQEPDAIMLCSMMPGVVSAIKQIRDAGITAPILNGSGVDGSYWMNAVPDLSDFYVPVQGSIYGDDPNPAVNEFNKKYKEATGGDRRASTSIRAT